MNEAAHGRRPIVVCIQVPAIVSGDTVLTTEGAGREMYASLEQVEAGHEGILDASIFVGHQHADETRVSAAVVLTGFHEAEAYMSERATFLAQHFWDCREAFRYPVACELLE